MTTAVVCDDDGIVRSAISDICEGAGLQVVAETDRGGDALELVRRFQVDVLVLDLSLIDGSGELTLRSLQHEPHRPEVVVFSAYANDPEPLLHLGAHGVVEKPDFERLGEVLAETATYVAQAAERAAAERRQQHRAVDPAPDLWRSPEGIARADDLLTTAGHTALGDSVLAITLGDGGPRPVGAPPDTTLGELLCATVRVQDVVHELPYTDGYVAVLRGGSEQAAERVWERLLAHVTEAGLRFRLHGACSVIDPLGMMAAVDRVERALASDAAESRHLQRV